MSSTRIFSSRLVLFGIVLAVLLVVPLVYAHAQTNVSVGDSRVSSGYTSGSEGGEVICTADAKQCPDGSWVGRTGLKCAFICPTPTEPPIGRGPDVPPGDTNPVGPPPGTETRPGGYTNYPGVEHPLLVCPVGQVAVCNERDCGCIDKADYGADGTLEGAPGVRAGATSSANGAFTNWLSGIFSRPVGSMQTPIGGGVSPLDLLRRFVVPEGDATQRQDANVCPQDARRCDDGSWVTRTGANCRFAACPRTEESPGDATNYPGVEHPGEDADGDVTNYPEIERPWQSGGYTNYPGVEHPIFFGVNGTDIAQKRLFVLASSSGSSFDTPDFLRGSIGGFFRGLFGSFLNGR